MSFYLFITIAMMSILLSRHAVRSLSTSTTSAALSSLLKNQELLSGAIVTDGRMSEDSSQTHFEVRNPAEPDAVLARVTKMGRQDAQRAIATSALALLSWRDGTTALHRSKLLTKWSQLIQDNAHDIATIMTLESGKPLAESRGELMYGVSFLDYYAAEALRSTGAGGGFLVPTPFANPDGSPRGQIMALQQAVGVCALIAPWNFPIAMITRKVGPALAAGCTAVVKPAELTPLTAVAVHHLALEAGIPPEVFQLVTSSHDTTPDVGHEFCTNELVRKVSFTGSTAVGRLLMKQSSDTVKRLSLELGGNAPFVVFDDANIDQAVNAAMASKYRNAGQTCVCADRFLVHRNVHDEFVRKLVDKVTQLHVGSGMDPRTTLGPLITAKAVQQVHDKVQQAVEMGAKLETGGQPMPELGPSFYAPTVLTNVSPQSRIWHEETFGPVAAILSFETDEEAREIANDCSVGLASYFCTTNLSRAFAFAQQLEAGLVGINEGIMSTALAPFGGVKQSGLGREGSSLGIQEYLETKYIFMNY